MSHKFLEPIKIGNQTVKNRVMFLAMAKNISNFDDSVSAKDIAYVESVAAGGVGLLVPGAMIVDPEWPSVLPLQPGIYDDRFIPGLRRLVLAAHKYDAKILFQLWHPGPRPWLCRAFDGRRHRGLAAGCALRLRSEGALAL